MLLEKKKKEQENLINIFLKKEKNDLFPNSLVT